VTAFLFVAGVVVMALVIAGVWLMERAGVVPAARATGNAPDPTEETEVRERVGAERAGRHTGVLIEHPAD
jgi:hypothetical protein